MKKLFVLVLAGLFVLSLYAPSISDAKKGGEATDKAIKEETIKKHEGKKKGEIKGKKKGEENKAVRATPAQRAIPTPGTPGATKAVPAIPAVPAKK